jgi:hypothetical protein
LRLDRDEAVTPAQLAPVDIKDKIFEAVEQDRDFWQAPRWPPILPQRLYRKNDGCLEDNSTPSQSGALGIGSLSCPVR